MATSKGLSHRFIVKDGRFQLTDGTIKVKDSIYFLFLFDYVVRVYYADFQPGMLPLVQKPGSSILKFRTLILGKIKKLILKYVPDVEVLDIDIKQFRSNAEKRFELSVAYKYTRENQEPQILVQFI